MEKIKISKRDMENERNILRLHGFHLRSIISTPCKFGEIWQMVQRPHTSQELDDLGIYEGLPSFFSL
jgi:hypothetical protein